MPWPHTFRAKRRNRGGTAEIGGDPELEPQPARTVDHVLVRNEDDFVDRSPYLLKDRLIGPAACHDGDTGRDLGKADHMSRGERCAQGRQADWLDADDADARSRRLDRRGKARNEPASPNGNKDRFDVGQLLEDLEANRALAATTAGSAKGWK